MITVMVMLFEIFKEQREYQNGKVYIASYKKVTIGAITDIALEVLMFLYIIINAFR